MIVGAGLAGCWLARLLAEDGVAVILLDEQTTVGCGASANPAGVVKPYVTREPTKAMQFYLAAHEYLLHQLHALQLASVCDFKACGVLQLTRDAYPLSEHYQVLDIQKANQSAGLPVGSHALLFSLSGCLSPVSLCRALVQHPLIHVRSNMQVHELHSTTVADGQTCWHVKASGAATQLTRHLVLANGHTLNQFEQTGHLPVIAARGQISRFRLMSNSPIPKKVISGRRYVIPDRDSVLVGASFERNNSQRLICPREHEENRRALMQLLPDIRVHAKAVDGFAGVRATTPDRLPLIGPVPNHARSNQVYASLHHGRALSTYPRLPQLNGLFAIGGLGSRGIVTAPLAAQMLADFLLHKPSAKRQHSLIHWASLCNPARFQIRALKRRYNRVMSGESK
ncbi:MAG: FAD-dependent 5-carboxymethylaminomethyl-2-thiouridine(34) oxidoreductase MnmC [Granulosicoccus sp.]|nr:FAD-dependent 5-carboxymethylaminomethyl-2-thiouridine(34) oxidoreductase MnmC [Granulosicoccus sp.]